jgi:hypothetical protein
MAGVIRFPATNTLAAYLDSADSVYGTGSDGTQILDGTTTILNMVPSSSSYAMTSDLFFHNLTIKSNVILAPNGYRIFVKNALILESNATIGFSTGFSSNGSIAQGGAANTAVTHSLGGSATGFSATAPTAATGGSNYYKQPRFAVNGYSISATGTTMLRGGAGGSAQAGGGVVILSSRFIYGPDSGTAAIKAPGTAPAGGGVILIISSAAALPASVTTNVAGQNVGTVNYMQLV